MMYILTRKMSNIGKDVIDIDSTEGYKSLDKRIKTKVFGQDDAVIQIVEAILLASLIKRTNKSIGSPIIRSTGTGKTETAQQLAEQLESKLIRFDMSETKKDIVLVN